MGVIIFHGGGGVIMGKTQKNYWLIYFTPSYDQIETSVREGENVSDSEID